MAGAVNRYVQRQVSVALLLTLLLTGTLWGLISGVWTMRAWLACWLLAANVTAFVYYGHDKRQARINSWRVPEAVLHSLVVVGGSIGAYLAMRLFRHKTIKGSFQIVFWLIVVIQVAVIAWLIFR